MDDTTTVGTDTDDHRFTLSASEVAAVVLDKYGFRLAGQRKLGGEVDLNVWIRTDEDREYLLKVTRGRMDDSLRWQQAVLDHLAKDAPDIPAPRLVRSFDGETMVPLDISGRPFVVRVLTWLPGTMLADLDQPPPYLLTDLGALAARLTQTLGRLPGNLSAHTHHWDIRNSRNAVDGALPFVQEDDDRRRVVDLMEAFDRALPSLASLPTGVVHQDLNDFNVLALPDADGRLTISGVLDFNDSLVSARVAELAVAVAYAMLRQADPLAAAAAVVTGFHSVVPLSEAELAVVFPLAAARLCVNATTWTRRTAESHHPYGNERMRHTWPALRTIGTIPAAAAEERFRLACDYDVLVHTDGTTMTASHDADNPPSIVTGWRELDLGPGGDFFDDRSWEDPRSVAEGVAELLGDRRQMRGFTRHLSPSMIRTAQRAPGDSDAATVQIGVHVLTVEGDGVRAPAAGEVARADVGGPLVLRHSGRNSNGQEHHWTCWWGITPSVSVGAEVAAGESIGTVAAPAQDVGLGPTFHVQMLLAERLVEQPPPVAVTPAAATEWAGVTADPADLLGIPPVTRPALLDVEAVLQLRDRRLARSQRAYYKEPPNLVRGRGVWLYDDFGRGYLDSVNNVSHVGHAEPRISQAAARQLKKLNTNSRFIYQGIATYAERLVATLPSPLEVVFLVCTGSEANDLALRMARQVTGRSDVLVIDGAYHGNTAAVMGISPNRYKGPGGRGAPPTTHEVPRPDVYRGEFGSDVPDAGARYAAEVEAVVDRLVAEGRPPAAFIAESLMGTAGNIVFPAGYLPDAFAAVRRAGGVCISDEVQVGVGRLGSHFWGFEVQGVVPDIVTMGKPLGNGHPIAAVVTTREIADAFDDGVKYFNTFGGNPVSCVIGTTVLDIVQQDGLQQHAAEVGAYFLSSLRELASRHELIGDVRGQGLYLGIELVRERGSKEPAVSEALQISEWMKDRGVISYPTGALDNVLKIKPPMVFDRGDVDLFVATLDDVLVSRPEGVPL